jgi:glycosyltransferase involved in cell wall biosynthesis
VNDPRVLIVGENASLRMGGEATKPFSIFRFLRRAGVDVRLLVHDRCRSELGASFPEELDRIHYVHDTPAQRRLVRLGQPLPDKVDYLTFRSAIQHITQRMQRVMARRLVREHSIDVVHQPVPISPKQVSSIHDVGAPVVIGPMCGGMDYPPAFRHHQGPVSRAVEATARAGAQVLNRVFPGKLRAAALIVANERTRLALPRGTRGRVYGMPESGVELASYPPIDYETRADDGLVRFLYLGRLVDWKMVDLLVDAFAVVARRLPPARLDIVGDGEELAPLRRRRDALKLAERVDLPGWASKAQGLERLRRADVFVMPSLRECGGNALLEAMAVGLPCVTANWGGPGFYVDDTCGIRVEPRGREQYVAGLADAMLRLGGSKDARAAMGTAARRRLAANYFTWESKMRRLMEIYRHVVAGGAGGRNGHVEW